MYTPRVCLIGFPQGHIFHLSIHVRLLQPVVGEHRDRLRNGRERVVGHGGIGGEELQLPLRQPR